MNDLDDKQKIEFFEIANSALYTFRYIIPNAPNQKISDEKLIDRLLYIQSRYGFLKGYLGLASIGTSLSGFNLLDQMKKNQKDFQFYFDSDWIGQGLLNNNSIAEKTKIAFVDNEIISNIKLYQFIVKKIIFHTELLTQAIHVIYHAYYRLFLDIRT